MDRRGFMRAATAGVVLAAAHPARAAHRGAATAPDSQGKVPRIGVLGESNPLAWSFQPDAFQLECRWAHPSGRRLGDLATELVALDVDAVVAVGVRAARAVAALTRTVPIVFVVQGDPVEAGLVANATGVSLLSDADLAARRLALLREAVPRVARLGVLSNPDNPLHDAAVVETRRAADRYGIEIQVAEERRAARLDDPFMVEAFSALGAGRVEALLVLPDALFSINADDLATLALVHGLPGLYPARTFTDRGGLMALHGNSAEVIRRVSGLVTAVLEGASPAALPVQRLDDLELTINVKAAAALELRMPPALLARADAVVA